MSPNCMAERAWRALRKSPKGMTARQVAERMDVPIMMASNALQRLARRGDAVYSGNGKWGRWRAITTEFVIRLGEHPKSLANLRANQAEWRKFLRMAQLARGADETRAVPLRPPMVRDPWAAAIFGDGR